MSVLTMQVNGNKVMLVIDLEHVFLCLLLIGQRRLMELGPLFAYNLCVVSYHSSMSMVVFAKRSTSWCWSTTLVCLRSFQHLVTFHRECFAAGRSTILCGHKVAELIASLQGCLIHYSDWEIIVFDMYQYISANVRESAPPQLIHVI